MAAKREMPVGGVRGAYGKGRVRSAQLGVSISPESLERLDAQVKAEGITRTVLIERWIDAYCPPAKRKRARSPKATAGRTPHPLPEGYVAPGDEQ
jgi:hypothetical protein